MNKATRKNKAHWKHKTSKSCRACKAGTTSKGTLKVGRRVGHTRHVGHEGTKDTSVPRARGQVKQIGLRV